MVDGSVNATLTSPANWKLAPAINAATQGLIASGFGDLPMGRALFLEFTWPQAISGGAWLQALRATVDITNGDPGTRQPRAAALAFSWTGLAYMGLDDHALASFTRPFREGMFQEDRSRRLGDRRSGEWTKAVVKNGPKWSANSPLRDPASCSVNAYDVPPVGPPEEQINTPLTVHALLLLYTATEADAIIWAASTRALLVANHVQTVHELDLVLDIDKSTKISREHFGFADGLSQPAPYGLSVPKDESGLVLLNGHSAIKDPVQGVPLGEILIGYQNGHSEAAPGPAVPNDANLKASNAKTLPPHPLAEGFDDLGLNGSYLVVRELKQDVAAFWASLKETAQRTVAEDPTATHINPDWLAERIVGRSSEGHLLCPAGYRAPDQYGLPDSNYLLHELDPHGVGCPVGSHVRRANPRDSLAPKPEMRQELLQAANNHRILRRGRKFGPKLEDRWTDDGQERGLLFMCLNTDIERQFEFVQQTWLLNSSFGNLFGEVDPLLGPDGPMTIREDPLRRTIHVSTYVEMAGGEYFFLPGMAALDYLSLL